MGFEKIKMAETDSAILDTVSASKTSVYFTPLQDSYMSQDVGGVHDAVQPLDALENDPSA